MINDIEYALMAGAAYRSNRPDINKFPVPEGWVLFNPQSLRSGFEAVSFTNGSEIVISFAGTDGFFTVDQFANLGLATGWGSEQLLQAADYYLAVKAVNPGANITFTGHSLGGGLAALMAVFFGESAVTFDQAPFANSAELGLLHPDVAANLRQYLLNKTLTDPVQIAARDSIVSSLDNFLTLRQANGGIPNSELVSTIRVEGEFTSAILGPVFDPIGAPATSLQHGPTDISPFTELHAQSLLTAFLQSEQSAPEGRSLSDVTYKLSELLKMIFDDGLYNFNTKSRNENFLDRLIRHEFGNAPGATDTDMLTRFTADLWQIAQDGGLTLTDNNLGKTLVAFSMQMYYEKTTTADKYLFTAVTGDIRFDFSDVAATLGAAKGYRLYFEDYLATLPAAEKAIITGHLPEIRDWYVQAGASDMNATDTNNLGAFMLGGVGGDTLTGGTGDDLLVGGAGDDTLTGGSSDDLLLGGSDDDILDGGEGYDTYLIEDQDTIKDSDGRGRIRDTAGHYIVGLIEKRADGSYVFLSDPTISVTKDPSLTLTLADGTRVIIENFKDGDFGLNLTEGVVLPVGTSIIGNDYSNRIKGPDTDANLDTAIPETTANRSLVGTDLNDVILALGGNDDVFANGGADRIEGGDGMDRLFGGLDNDVIAGGAGSDILVGDEGADWLYADTSVALADAITSGGGGGSGVKGDFLAGGAGRDILIGSTGNDVLTGGAEEDVLVGGAGDDDLHGDATFVAGNRTWQVIITMNGDTETHTYTETEGAFNSMNDSGDVIYAGTGNDTVWGNGGDDVLYGEGDADALEGGTGNDYVDGGEGNDRLWGDEGNDILIGGSGDDTLRGDGGDDVLYGEGGADALTGGTGNDYVDGGEGNDRLWGEQGNDVLIGGNGNDELQGGMGNDQLKGGSGNDALFGDNPGDLSAGGDDYLDGGIGDDHLEGGMGNDALLGGSGVDRLLGEDGNDQLEGGEGDDLILGGAGDDALYGDAGNDELQGGAGNDVLAGGDGNDLLIGDDDNDTLVGNEGNDELQGGAGADFMFGDVGADLLFGQAGNDGLYGGDDNDLLLGGEGDDILEGGDGNDQLQGGAGNDIISGNTGVDFLFGEDGDDVLYGDAGDDELQGGTGNDILAGGTGNDRLFGEDGDDILTGADGNDVLVAGSGADFVTGGAGDDLLLGDTENDVLYGEEGNDGIEGGEGDDTLDGGAGDDQLFGQAGDDILHGGQGNDLLVGGGGNDILNGDAGNDQLQGRDGDDTLNGGVDDDALYGQAGNDILRGDAGNDLLVAGEGDDTAEGGADNDLLYGQVGNDHLSGGEGDDALYGNEGMDILLGGAGDDSLRGGTGDDVLAGGDGNDTYIFNIGDGVDSITDTGANTLSFGGGIYVDSLSLAYGSLLIKVGDNGDAIHIENFNPDDVFSGSGIDRFQFADGTVLNHAQLLELGFDLNGTEGDDVIRGTNASDRIMGFAGNDTLTGQAGNDTLEGGVGADTMTGGVGDDIYWVDDVADIVIENIDEGTDTVRSTLSYTLAANVENLQLEGINALDGAGNDLDNILTGNNADNLLAGADGNDMLQGKDGNDILDGGAGVDVLEGGAGDDQYFIDNASDVMIEYANSGTDTVNSTMSHILAYEMENLNLIGTAAVNGRGNVFDNIVTGNDADNILSGDAGNDTLNGAAGNDVLEGGAGADSMAGGAGDDTYIVENAADAVSERVDQGMDTVYSTLDYTLGANVENLVLENPNSLDEFYAVFGTGNDLDNTITGNDFSNGLRGGIGNDTLIGGLGDDGLIGGTGADIMMGEGGSDIYYVDDAGDRVIETEPDSEDGTDLVFSTISHVLTANVENLVLLNYYGNLSGTGNTLNNVIYGNEADNQLSGLAGSDELRGEGGDDILEGGIGSDSLDGGSGNDALMGNDGDDILYGGSGSDLMIGGAGDDTYYVDNAYDVTDEAPNSGNDTVISFMTHTLGDGVENLQLMGFYVAINGTGNDLNNRITGDFSDNVLTGLAGDDWINGGNGIDTMIGGMGNDTYRVSNSIEAVIENANEGIDSVESTDTFILPDNVENLRVLGNFSDSHYVSGLDGTGNDLDNHITGNDAEGILKGLGGNDIIDGRAGNDVIDGGSGNDNLYGGDDAVYREHCGTPPDMGDVIPLWLEVPETLPVGDNYYEILASNADTLSGGDGNDTIDGGSGDDTLFGDEGDDTLYGGDDGLVASSNCSSGGGGYLSPLFALTEDVSPREGVTRTIEFLSNNDYLEGGAGNDHLDGGSGNDVLSGGEGADVLLGGNDGRINASNDDYLDGGTGIDIMAGGTGNDVYIVDGVYELLPPVTPDECDIGAGDKEPSPTMITTADLVMENANDGYDTIYSSVSLVLPENVEVLQFVGTANIDVIGNSDYNLILGNAGNNRIDGGQGADYMAGSIGDDTYYVDSIDDIVVEYLGEGIDTVRAYLNDYHLGENLENLNLARTVAIGYGNELNNRIRGNAADNVIFGDAGDDIIAGAGGNDQLVGGSGNDEYIFGRGDGHDVVLDAGGEMDRVTLVSDLTPEDITLHRDGDNVVISIKGTDDAMVLADWFNATNSVESIEFCHGGVIDKQAIERSVNNHAPHAADDAVSVREDLIPAVSGNVLINDTDAEPGTVLAVTDPGIYAGAFGTLVLSVDGSYTYTLDNASSAVQSLMDGQAVTENFIYRVQDNDPFRPLSNSASLVVTIVGANDVPVVQADTAHVGEDGVLTAQGNALVNDSDADQGAVLTVANAGTYASAYGSLIVTADGSYAYALDNTSSVVQELRGGETVTDSFDYSASDGITSTTGKAEIRIAGRNDAPEAMDDGAAVQEDLIPVASGNVLANDRDVDHDTLLSVLNTGTYVGTYGTLALGANGAYTYTLGNASAAVQSLAAGQIVSESFAYAVQDDDPNQSLHDGATLTVAISGTNDAPILMAPLVDQAATANTAFSYQVPAEAFVDIDAGDRLTLSATLADGTALPAWLTFDAVTRIFSGVAASGSGVLNIRVDARDLAGAGASDIFTLTVADAGKGNEGVGNGQDAPPPGHDYNQNDGPGTAPGSPGSRGGRPANGISVQTVSAVNIIEGGNGKDNLTGTAGADLLSGGGQDDVLAGGAGNDILEGGAGNDILAGDAGNDTYRFGRGSGQDQVNNYDTQSTDDKVVFGATIAADQLWFRKSNNDLRVSIIGAADQITLRNWYLGSDYRVDKLQTADGSVLLENQVEQLRIAMAAFAPPFAGRLTLPPDMQTALQPVIATSWQASAA